MTALRRLRVDVAECRGCGCSIPRRGRDRKGWCDSCRVLSGVLWQVDGTVIDLRARPDPWPQLFTNAAETLSAIAAEIRRQLRERRGEVWDYVEAQNGTAPARDGDGGAIVRLDDYRPA